MEKGRTVEHSRRRKCIVKNTGIGHPLVLLPCQRVWGVCSRPEENEEANLATWLCATHSLKVPSVRKSL